MDAQPVCISNRLPSDVLITILEKLKNADDRNAFGLTCRRWFEIQSVARRSLIFQLSCNPKDYKKYGSYLPKLLARFPFLSTLSLAGCTELPNSALSQLSHSGLSLRSLAFYFCLGVTDDGLARVSTGCPNLVTLTLQSCNITDAGLESVAKSCHALKNVSFAFCKLISDSGIKALCRGCPVICALIISSCKKITGEGFKGCPGTLTYLEADSCMLSPEGLSEAMSGGGLEYLNVSNLQNFIGVNGLGRIGDSLAKNLRFLNLRVCRYVSDQSVASIAGGCPLLEEWNLAVCHEIRFSGWSAIGSSCKNLRVLHVNRCRNFSDRGLQALADGCQRLEVLYMHGCHRVTGLGMESFKMLRQDVTIRSEERVNIGPHIDQLFA